MDYCVDINSAYAGGSISFAVERDSTDGSVFTFDDMYDVLIDLYINETIVLQFSKIEAEGKTLLIRQDEDTLLVIHDGIEEKGILRMRVELQLTNPLFPDNIQKLVGEAPIIAQI